MQTQKSIEKLNYQLEINQTIDAFFEYNIDKAFIINGRYATLWKELHHLINSGGKRLRPQMTLLTYDIFGGTKAKNILPVAAAQELLHLGMLIHDDIIDRDFVRYGVNNIAGKYRTLYEPYVSNKKDLLHYAQTSALLAGDLLISGSYQMIMTAPILPEKIIAVQQLLGNSIFDAAGGELLDAESVFCSSDDISAETIYYYKTASYTFVGPLMTGALLADASSEDKIFLQLFAENLGIAYQLADDLLGVFGNKITTGKSSSSDLIEGKRTYLVEQFYKVAKTHDKKLFESYFSKKTMNQEEINILKELLISTQAKSMTEKAISLYVARARLAIDHISIKESSKQQLSDLIDAATKRDK